MDDKNKLRRTTITIQNTAPEITIQNPEHKQSVAQQPNAIGRIGSNTVSFINPEEITKNTKLRPPRKKLVRLKDAGIRIFSEKNQEKKIERLNGKITFQDKKREKVSCRSLTFQFIHDINPDTGIPSFENLSDASTIEASVGLSFSAAEANFEEMISSAVQAHLLDVEYDDWDDILLDLAKISTPPDDGVIFSPIIICTHDHAMVGNLVVSSESGVPSFTLHFYDPEFTNFYQEAKPENRKSIEKLVSSGIVSFLGKDRLSAYLIKRDQIVTIFILPNKLHNSENFISPKMSGKLDSTCTLKSAGTIQAVLWGGFHQTLNENSENILIKFKQKAIPDDELDSDPDDSDIKDFKTQYKYSMESACQYIFGNIKNAELGLTACLVSRPNATVFEEWKKIFLSAKKSVFPLKDVPDAVIDVPVDSLNSAIISELLRTDSDGDHILNIVVSLGEVGAVSKLFQLYDELGLTNDQVLKILITPGEHNDTGLWNIMQRGNKEIIQELQNFLASRNFTSKSLASLFSAGIKDERGTAAPLHAAVIQGKVGAIEQYGILVSALNLDKDDLVVALSRRFHTNTQSEEKQEVEPPEFEEGKQAYKKMLDTFQLDSEIKDKLIAGDI
jgi:hypothetical protein